MCLLSNCGTIKEYEEEKNKAHSWFPLLPRDITLSILFPSIQIKNCDHAIYAVL